MNTMKSFADLATLSATQPILRTKPMSKAKELALVMLEHEVVRELAEDHRPDYCESLDAQAEWRTLVRTTMAQRIRELLRPINVRGKRVRPALLKLRGLRNHQAFERTTACDAHWSYRNRTCDCPTETRKQLRRSIAAVRAYDRPWHLLLVYLTYQTYVQHWYDFGQTVEGSKGHENGDPRVWEGDRRPAERIDRYEKDEDTGEDVYVGTDLVEVVDGGKTAFLNVDDLQGWDRATSFAKKPNATGERPTKPGKVYTYTATKQPKVNGRPVTRHGVPVVITEVFERRRGSWYYTSTNERTNRILNHLIEQRWRATLETRDETDEQEKKTKAPAVRYNAEAYALCTKAAAVKSFRKLTYDQLLQLKQRLTTAIDQLDEMPAGTMTAYRKLVRRIAAYDRLAAYRTRHTPQPWTMVGYRQGDTCSLPLPKTPTALDREVRPGMTLSRAIRLLRSIEKIAPRSASTAEWYLALHAEVYSKAPQSAWPKQ